LLDDRVAATAASRRFAMVAIVAFGAIALILAAIGIYGVLAYTVTTRRFEIGVRMALGATSDAILRRTLGGAAAMALSGIVFGVAAAFVSTRCIAKLLYGVRPSDPMAYVAGALLLLAAALLGAYAPARRASRVDPLLAIRARPVTAALTLAPFPRYSVYATESLRPSLDSLLSRFMPSTTSTASNSLALAQRAAQIAIDNKAQDVVILDLRGVSDMTDFFIVASGTSDTAVRSIGQHVVEEMKKEGSPAHHIEGLEKGRWVLLDFVDFVVHIFHPTLRNFYQLERLWSDAEQIPVAAQ
jgi:ribosome silencing factor RsfS/YbeB/iojap